MSKPNIVEEFLANPSAPMTERVGRRLCRYLVNSKTKETDAAMIRVFDAVNTARPAVSDDYFKHVKSLAVGMLFRKDGELRATPTARRFTFEQACVLRDADNARVVAFAQPDAPYRGSSGNYHNGHTYLIWRFDSPTDHLHVYCVPWQNNVNPAKTGLFIYS